MPLEDADDLAVFFDTEEFALAGTCNGSAVQVIRDQAYLQSLGIVAGVNPVALARASQFSGDDWNGSAITIDGTSYVIRGREPQDDGALVLLQLHAS